ncbi:MAG: type II toxin-antitoxin system VapC family toxin [Thermomicrobiales bacterium]
MKALLDNDVILDLFLYRRPFVHDAISVWEANAEGRFEAFVSGITPVNLFYVGRKNLGAAVVRQSVTELLIAVQVCPIDRAILRAAEQLPFSDYEDAVQHASAMANGLEAIVTRNLNHYKSATLPIFSPASFLAQLAQ